MSRVSQAPEEGSLRKASSVVRLEWFDADASEWKPAAINREWTEVRRVTRVPIRLVNVDTGIVEKEFHPS